MSDLLAEWFGWRGRSNRRRAAPRLEALEDRLAPAAINWVNRLSATDTFTTQERAVVDQAIDAWSRIILDFDGDPFNAPRTFNVTISGGSTSGLNLVNSSGSATVAGLADQYSA